MLATIELIQVLLVRGWMISGREKSREGRPCYTVITYTDPGGISGDDYQSPDLATFPPAVAEWILHNVPPGDKRRE
jgi:hypothetical protein